MDIDYESIDRMAITVSNRDNKQSFGVLRIPKVMLIAKQFEDEQWLPLVVDDQENDVGGELRIRLARGQSEVSGTQLSINGTIC